PPRRFRRSAPGSPCRETGGAARTEYSAHRPRTARWTNWLRLRLARQNSWASLLFGRVADRQRDTEASAFAGRGIHFDAAMVFLDDAVSQREPESGPLAHGLGGKEG